MEVEEVEGVEEERKVKEEEERTLSRKTSWRPGSTPLTISSTSMQHTPRLTPGECTHACRRRGGRRRKGRRRGRKGRSRRRERRISRLP